MTLSKSLQQRLDELIEKYPEPKQELVNELLDIAQTHNIRGEPKTSTTINRMSLFKKYFKENTNYPDEFLHEIKASDKLMDEYVAQSAENRAKRKTFLITDKLLDKIKKLKNSSTLVDRLIYLLFATGRRLNEIVNPEYKVSKRQRHDDQIVFSHLSKQPKKQKEIVQLIPEENSKDIISMIKKFRDEVKKYDMNHKDMNGQARYKTAKLKKGLHPHSLRGIYALYMWYEDNKRTQNRTGYIKEILNHTDPDSSLSYNHYIMEHEEQD